MSYYFYFPTVIYHSIETEFLDDIKNIGQLYLNSIDDDIAVENDYLAENNFNHIPFIKQSVDVANDTATSTAVSYFYNKSIDQLNQSGYDTDAYDFTVSAWFQEVSQYSQHDIHNHNESCMSGLYFFDVHDNDCFPVFYDPRREKVISSLCLKETQDINTATTTINFCDGLRNGSFFIFESWLSHKITMNTSPDKTTKFLHLCLHQRRKI